MPTPVEDALVAGLVPQVRSAGAVLTDLDERLARGQTREDEAKSGRATKAKVNIFAAYVRLSRIPSRDPITADVICRVADVSTATLYKHFKNGLSELVLHFAVRLSEHVIRRVDYDCDRLRLSTATERMTVTLTRLADVLMTYPRLFSVDSFPDAAREELSQPLLAALLSGQEKGQLDFDLRRAQLVALYHLNGLIALLTLDPPMSYSEVSELLVRQIIPATDLDRCVELLGRLTYDKSQAGVSGKPMTGNVHLKATEKPYRALMALWVPPKSFEQPSLIPPARRKGHRPS